ncbi:transglutaminase-like cysteine peptidase [Parvibaculum sp.]|uniref:transglutaminase-like cysteine peptidase n=1 Tax=Parvibaculum sp. TaxID=2024848 RepID=UPI00391BDE57
MSWRKKFMMAAGALALLAGCQSPEYVGSIKSSAFVPQQGGVRLIAANMPTYQQVAPPFGYIGFCIRHPDECAGGTDTPKPAAMTPEKWLELSQVNEYVNRTVPQIDDIDLYGRAEWWAFPDERGGDCEDFALEKRRLLIQRGWAPENLLVSVVREWNGDGHAVLLVRTDRGEFVLDNKTWDIAIWSDTPYQWIKRQSEERPYIWVNLDASAARVAVKNQPLPPVGEKAPFLAAIEKKSPAPSLRPGVEDGLTAAVSASKEEPTAAIN